MTAKPIPPVTDIGQFSLAGSVSPAVVSVADKIIVVFQGDAQTAISVGQPIGTTGMMNENQFYRGCGRRCVGSLLAAA